MPARIPNADTALSVVSVGMIAAFGQPMQREKRFVYVLRSDRDCDRYYVGLTADVAKRLTSHNAGQNRYTVRDRPWSVVVSLEFRTEAIALRFERYLKSGSGRAFAKRHFG